MLGKMMNFNLSLTAIMRYGEQVAAHSEIVSLFADGRVHRYTYKDAFARVRRLANVLDSFALGLGARVGTLAWNDHRHFELHYGAPCTGRVCHTINPKLFPEQISYIINHAQDEILFIDPQFIPLVEGLYQQITHVRHFVALCEADELPQSSLPNLCSYEALLADAPETYSWPDLDENTACGLCYTSGTTGNPKGVLTSHRSATLHGMSQNMAENVGLRAADVVLPLVPMFHVSAWGMPYNVPMVGAKLVLPGPRVGNGAEVVKLINTEAVTISLGVPTLWTNLANFLDESGEKVPSLRTVVSGGAACPLSLIRRFLQHGVAYQNAWGMTETSPMGSFNRKQPWYEDLPEDAQAKQLLKAGRCLFGMEMRIVDEDGHELAHDGETAGQLQVRGPWVCSGYYGQETTEDWFATGDVATLDCLGYLQITDRIKDVIKSGGEWISSVDIENAIAAHPGVAEAAVIGVPHPRWSERPLLVIVPKHPDEPLSHHELISFLEDKIAKWWLPDASEQLPELPHTATGKVSKKILRERFADYLWP